ncbi:Phosphoribosyl 1,2-cyclic phosphodiesterase [Fontimonas thermophila]|uniref:Phosphoribosyl 1,2-cyclic phosphodiesterase n=1 Tax=Fontimonas thermophila TaxID=1076937 RepID=A0A1I2IYS9_9GAMM|nr:MBL fold metallo-hydrolase [Fontimonas thermophila]SFF47339.1 Phosphoribosyl 1,2-cyclic phosphodiesterase [Fontimonas thermophila]
MRFAMLGSGSRGNGTLVESGGTRVLIDCGFALGEAELRLQRLGIEPAALDAILVTHEHGDHLSGVARLARRYRIPVWMTHGSYAIWKDRNVPHCLRFSPHQAFRIGELEVQPYPVPHDAREPCQYVFGARGLRLGVLSDAGAVTPHMRAMLAGCDALLLECNYDPDLLRDGPYPPALKLRVGGGRGHLSNEQAASLLRGYAVRRLQHLVLTHLSETNNTPALARRAVAEVLEDDPAWLVCAEQDAGLGWREVV